MRRFVTSLLCAAAIAAAPQALAAPASFKIDPTHTFVHFEIMHLGLSHFTGRFDDVDGSIVYDREAGTGKVDIRVQVASANTGVEKLDQHLQTDEFFHAEKYPEVRFVGDQFTVTDGEVLAVSGELTLLGVTRPVTLQFTHFNCLDAHPMARVPACGGNAVTNIKRSDFGMDAYIPAVGDDVRLSVEVEALIPQEDGEGA
ncbi:YceI family protein [Algiphilus sp. NNCM1]|uniref:YceI family protein n=1 Tax=Algiphilus sp. TaxID=1872431 RepID=UPI001CA6BA27|nr:YceI family protein [Algiphilus sp.]MBY8966676.1 YceI family protein [Algiphilus acroporae]MCI5103011.1 YceI family protein [Algiphilus sp.]